MEDTRPASSSAPADNLVDACGDSGQPGARSKATEPSPASSESAHKTQILDFSNEEVSGSSTEFSLGPYNRHKHEDHARKLIALILLSMLFTLVVGILALVLMDKIAVAEIKEFAVVLGPVVALVSAATGFYFGTKSQ